MRKISTDSGLSNKGALLYTVRCSAWGAVLGSPFGRAVGAADWEGKHDHTKGQQPTAKRPAASQGNDSPWAQALVSFSPQISGKNLQTANHRQIHCGLLLCFCKVGYRSRWLPALWASGDGVWCRTLRIFIRSGLGCFAIFQPGYWQRFSWCVRTNW